MDVEIGIGLFNKNPSRVLRVMSYRALRNQPAQEEDLPEKEDEILGEQKGEEEEEERDREGGQIS